MVLQMYMNKAGDEYYPAIAMTPKTFRKSKEKVRKRKEPEVNPRFL